MAAVTSDLVCTFLPTRGSLVAEARGKAVVCRDFLAYRDDYILEIARILGVGAARVSELATIAVDMRSSVARFEPVSIRVSESTAGAAGSASDQAPRPILGSSSLD